MKMKYIKTGVFVLLLIFLASYITYQMKLPAAEDLPRLIKNGEMIVAGDFDVLTKNVYSYTTPNNPFANHHWFSAVLFYVLYVVAGFSGITVFKILVILATFSLLFYLSIKKANFWLVSLLSIPTIIILMGRSSARPEIFSYLFIVLYLYIFYLFEKNPSTRKIFWLIPLQLLWTNMHLFFGVGLMLVGGLLLEKVILNFKNLKKDRATIKLAVVFIMMISTLFLTPYGIRGAIHSLKVNTSYDAPIFSAETQSIATFKKTVPPIDNIALVVFPYMAVLLGVSFLVRWRRRFSWKNMPIFYLLASAATIFVGFKVIRSLPMFGLVFLLVASQNITPTFTYVKDKIKNRFPDSRKFLKYTFIVLFGFLIVYMIFPARKVLSPYAEFGIGLSLRSNHAAEFFKENGLKGPIFNDTDIGSYLIFHLYPEEKVFVDNRFGDAYPATFFKRVYQPMTVDEAEWKYLADVYRINTIIFYQYDGGSGARDFLYRRIYDLNWVWVYADDNVVILVKNTPENQTVIDKYRITKENIKEKLRFLEESSRIDDKLSAADLYSLVGFYDLASEVYLKIVSEHPERGKIWMILGSIELTKANQEDSNPSLALVYLKKAIDEGWKTPESYSYLALAYYRIGEIEKAKEAVNKQLRIDPDNQNGKNWLDRFDTDEFPDTIKEKKLYEQSRNK